MLSAPRLTALAATCVLAMGCSPQVATRGNMVEEDRLAEVRVGFATQDDVAQILGTPTTTATFDSSVWYYIGQRTEQTAFFRPEVTDRKVITVRFDRGGRVSEIEESDLSAAREVDIVDRETPTGGRELGILEQLLGNIGRFRPPGTGGQ